MFLESIIWLLCSFMYDIFMNSVLLRVRGSWKASQHAQGEMQGDACHTKADKHFVFLLIPTHSSYTELMYCFSVFSWRTLFLIADNLFISVFPRWWNCFGWFTAQQSKYLQEREFLTVVIHWQDVSMVHQGHHQKLGKWMAGLSELNLVINWSICQHYWF